MSRPRHRLACGPFAAALSLLALPSLPQAFAGQMASHTYTAQRGAPEYFWNRRLVSDDLVELYYLGAQGHDTMDVIMHKLRGPLIAILFSNDMPKVAHYRRITDLTMNILRASSRGPEGIVGARPRAYALGWLTHYVNDKHVHFLVNRYGGTYSETDHRRELTHMLLEQLENKYVLSTYEGLFRRLPNYEEPTLTGEQARSVRAALSWLTGRDWSGVNSGVLMGHVAMCVYRAYMSTYPSGSGLRLTGKFWAEPRTTTSAADWGTWVGTSKFSKVFMFSNVAGRHMGHLFYRAHTEGDGIHWEALINRHKMPRMPTETEYARIREELCFDGEYFDGQQLVGEVYVPDDALFNRFLTDWEGVADAAIAEMRRVLPKADKYLDALEVEQAEMGQAPESLERELRSMLATGFPVDRESEINLDRPLGPRQESEPNPYPGDERAHAVCVECSWTDPETGTTITRQRAIPFSDDTLVYTGYGSSDAVLSHAHYVPFTFNPGNAVPRTFKLRTWLLVNPYRNASNDVNVAAYEGVTWAVTNVQTDVARVVARLYEDENGQQGRPLKGATVVLVHTSTQEQRTFREHPPTYVTTANAGEYEIRIHAPGYEPVRRSLELFIRQDCERTYLLKRLPSAIRVQVTDARTGARIPGATVTLASPTGAGSSASPASTSSLMFSSGPSNPPPAGGASNAATTSDLMFSAGSSPQSAPPPSAQTAPAPTGDLMFSQVAPTAPAAQPSGPNAPATAGQGTQATTDAKGECVFEKLTMGTHKLTATAAGYAPLTTPAACTLSLSGNATPQPVTLALSPLNCILDVTVIDDRRTPIPDAVVTVEGVDRGRTDAKGSLTVRGVPAGTNVAFEVRAAGCTPCQDSLRLVPTQPDERIPKEVTLVCGATLVVSVLDGDAGHRALTGATVTVECAVHLAPKPVSGTPPKAVFAGIPPGVATLTATRDGYGQLSPAGVTFGPNSAGTTQETSVVLFQGTSVRVIVHEADDKKGPMAGPLVAIDNQDYVFAPVGTHTFQAVKDGDHVFKAKAPGHEEVTTDVNVASKKTTNDVHLYLRPACSVRAEIRDATDRLISAQTSATLIPLGNSAGKPVTLHGHAPLFCGLKAGRYKISATAERYEPGETSEFDVTESSGDLTKVIRLKPMFGVYDLCVTGDMFARSDTTVLFELVDGGGRRVDSKHLYVDAGASFQDSGMCAFLDLPSGTYSLKVSAPGYKTVRYPVTLPGPSGAASHGGNVTLPLTGVGANPKNGIFRRKP